MWLIKNKNKSKNNKNNNKKLVLIFHVLLLHSFVPVDLQDWPSQIKTTSKNVSAFVQPVRACMCVGVSVYDLVIFVRLGYPWLYLKRSSTERSEGHPERAAVYTDKTHFVRRHDCVCSCVLFMSVCCCFLFVCLFFAHHMGSHTPSSEDLAPNSLEWIMSSKVIISIC